MSLEETLKQLVLTFCEAIGDEFAPKQPGGSPERKRLIGIIAENTHEISDAANNIRARVLELTDEEYEKAFKATDNANGDSPVYLALVNARNKITEEL